MIILWSIRNNAAIHKKYIKKKRISRNGVEINFLSFYNFERVLNARVVLLLLELFDVTHKF